MMHEKGGLREAPAPPSSSMGRVVETGIAAFLEAIWRRRLLFFGAVSTLLVLAVVAVFAITPRYTAEVRVMVDPREQNVVDIAAVLSRLSADDPTIQSEIQVLLSEDLARRVIQATDLMRSSEFNPDLEQPLVERLLQSLDWPWLNTAFGAIDVAADGPGAEQRIRARIIDNYFDRLEVRVLGRNSRVIGISFSSESPEVAAQVANAIAETYLALQLEGKLAATEGAADWLEERIEGLSHEVTVAEQAIEDMRASVVAEGGWAPELFEQQISEVNIQLIQARTSYEKARAELEQIEGLVAIGGAESVFEVVDPQLLIWTNEQLMWLRRSEAELKAQYGPDHPVVGEVRDVIRRSIEETSAQLIAGARNRTEVSRATVRALEDDLRRLLEESIAFRRAQVRLRATEREARATTELFETFLMRSKETAQRGLEQPDARIISQALVPDRPTFPNRLLLLGVALVGSIALSGTLVGFAEGLEGGYRNSEQLSRDLRVGFLGEIPWIRRRAENTALADLILEQPLGAHAEALRTIATSIEVSSDRPDRGKPILITSSLSSEGKTSLVTGLGRTMAKTTSRVLVIDCDLRHPQCHERLGLRREPGLTSHLSGAASVEEIIQKDGSTALELIAAGESAESPGHLLRSPKFAELLRRLQQRYEIILLDSPPLLPIADARAIAAVVNCCVMVVRWRTTDRRSVLRAFEQLTQAGGKILGVVLSQVREKTSHDYGFYYASYHAAHADDDARRRSG